MINTKPTALAQAVLLSTLFIGTSAQATTFLPQDPRALGMGGTSVAIANSSQAHYYNPSLLHNARQDEDFNFEIDLMLRVTDGEGLIGALNTFGEQNLIEEYQTGFDRFDTNLQGANDNLVLFQNELNAAIPNPTDLQTHYDALDANLDALEGADGATIQLRDATNGLKTGLESVSGKPLTFDLGAGISTSVPNMNTISWGFYANVWTTLSLKAQFAKEDGDVISEVSDTLTNLDATITSVRGLIDPNDLAGTNPTTITEPLEDLSDSLNTVGGNDFQEGLQSSVIVSGGVIRELGLSLATNYAISGYEFDVGLTPKLLTVDATDHQIFLNDNTSGDDATFDINDVKTHNSFNADIGISKLLTENWKTGLVIKNLIPQSFDTPNGLSEIKISPAVRVGASYQNEWVSAAADLDLTENEAMGGGSNTRYLALGAEFDAWLLKLRAGYRANLSNGSAVPSLGLGLYLVGLNIDFAVAANSFEVPADEDEAKEFDDISTALRIGIQW